MGEVRPPGAIIVASASARSAPQRTQRVACRLFAAPQFGQRLLSLEVGCIGGVVLMDRAAGYLLSGR
jgi:hypothetical protein